MYFYRLSFQFHILNLIFNTRVKCYKYYTRPTANLIVRKYKIVQQHSITKFRELINIKVFRNIKPSAFKKDLQTQPQTMQEVKDSKSLEQLTVDQLFELQNLAVFEMFTIPQIHKRLKSNVKKFSDFLKSNESFLFEMINLGIKIPIHQSKDQKMKQVCFVALDMLTQDYDCIIDLFIKEDLEEFVQDDQVYENIHKNQVTGQIIIQAIKTEKLQDDQTQSRFQQKYKYLNQLLRYLECSEINESCLNYMITVLECIIKKSSSTLMNFFSVKKNYLDKLIQLAYYPSVSQMLVKMISDQDKTKEYKYKHMKIQIIEGVGDFMRKHINDDWYFQGYLEFIDRIFDSTKSTYQENIEDFKDLADSLVSQNYVKFYLQTMIKVGQQNIANNCLLFLNKVIRRRNYDEEMDEYDRQNFPVGNQEKQPTKTMNFQLGILYDFMEELIVNYSKKISKYSNLTKMNFYEVLTLLTKHSQFKAKIKELKSKSLSILFTLLENLEHQKKNGLVKFYIQNLFEKYIRNSQLTGQQTVKLIQKVQSTLKNKEQMVEENLSEEKKQKLAQNKNQNRPFIVKILLLIENQRQIISERQKEAPQKTLLHQIKSAHDLIKIRQFYSAKINDFSPSKHKKKCFSFIENPNGTEIVPLQCNKPEDLQNAQKFEPPIDSPTRKRLNLQECNKKIQQRRKQTQKLRHEKQQIIQRQIIQEQVQVLTQLKGITLKKVQSSEQATIVPFDSKKSEENKQQRQEKQGKPMQQIIEQQLQVNCNLHQNHGLQNKKDEPVQINQKHEQIEKPQKMQQQKQNAQNNQNLVQNQSLNEVAKQTQAALTL